MHNKPLRWPNPPWIPEHLSKSNFSKLTKLEMACITTAVMTLLFFKLKDVKFVRPNNKSNLVIIQPINGDSMSTLKHMKARIPNLST